MFNKTHDKIGIFHYVAVPTFCVGDSAAQTSYTTTHHQEVVKTMVNICLFIHTYIVTVRILIVHVTENIFI